jgi:hypothetical protein
MLATTIAANVDATNGRVTGLMSAVGGLQATVVNSNEAATLLQQLAENLSVRSKALHKQSDGFIASIRTA